MPDPGQDKDFLSLNPADQHRYLRDTDPDYKALSSADQAAYLAHITNQPMQEGGKKEGFASALGSDLKNMVPKIPPLTMGNFAKSMLGPAGQIISSAVDVAKRTPEEDTQRKNAGYSLPYRAVAPLAEAVGANVSGMEDAAKRGDVGGVAGHAAAVPTVMAATEGVGRGISALPEGLAGQAMRTAGKTLANQSIERPFKAVSKIPDYWRESSPENRMLAETKRAVGERRASMIPMRVKPEAPVEASNPLPMTHDAGPLGRIGPNARPAAEAGDALATLPRPIGGYDDMNRFLKQDSSALGQINTPNVTPRMNSWPVPRTRGVNLVPEPRTPFAGENEGYMASTPREELQDLAMSRKPGAGRQLQQLGKPIIYIPTEADIE